MGLKSFNKKVLFAILESLLGYIIYYLIVIVWIKSKCPIYETYIFYSFIIAAIAQIIAALAEFEQGKAKITVMVELVAVSILMIFLLYGNWIFWPKSCPKKGHKVLSVIVCCEVITGYLCIIIWLGMIGIIILMLSAENGMKFEDSDAENYHAIHEKNQQTLSRKKTLRSVSSKLMLSKPDLLTKGHMYCPICKKNYEEGQKVIVLPCDPSHFFHSVCIKRYMKNISLCPICQSVIKEENLENYKMIEFVDDLHHADTIDQYEKECKEKKKFNYVPIETD